MFFGFTRRGSSGAPHPSKAFPKTKLHPASLALAALLLVPGAAAAQSQSCPHAPAIVALSDIVLAQREALPRLQQRRHGPIAAYLKIRYGAVEDSEAEAMLERLQENPSAAARELALAWTIHKLGPSPEPKALEALIASQPEQLLSRSALRALLLAGADELVIGYIWAQPAEHRPMAVRDMMVALLDLPDTRKAELGRIAARGNFIDLAAVLAATQSDPEAWNTFIASVSDPAKAEQLARTWRWLPATMGNPELQLPGNPPANTDPAVRAKLHDLLSIAAIHPQGEFLTGLLNYSGLIDQTHAAAQVVRQAIESGAVAPKGTLDAGWLLAYRALVEAIPDAALLEDNLNALPATVQRPGRANSRQVLDWIIAADALGPFLRGEVETVPEVPEGVSADLAAQWPQWTDLASTIQRGAGVDVAAGDEQRLLVAAELIFAKGDHDALAELLNGVPASLQQVAAAEDFAERLDRACASHLWHPAEALLLLDTPVFKFDSPQSDQPAGQ